MISACAFNQDTRFSFSKIEQSVKKACFVFFFLFIFFHRTTFGVAKASVCFREAATKKCYETGQIHSKKVRAINYRATATAKNVCENQTVKMAINNLFGLQKNHLKDSLYQKIKFI